MARKVKTPPPPGAPSRRPSSARPLARRRAEQEDPARSAPPVRDAALVVGFFALTGGGDDAESAEGRSRRSGRRVDVPADHEPGPDSRPSSGRLQVQHRAGDKRSLEPDGRLRRLRPAVSEINYVPEHGAVGMFYGPDVPEETVAQMQEYYNQDPRGLIMAPDDRLGDQIALTAWTVHREGQDLRRGGLRHVRRGVRLPRARVVQERHRAGLLPPREPRARQPVAPILGRPGWRNWLYAADLKSAVPYGGAGSSPAPGTSLILAPRSGHRRRHPLAADGLGHRARRGCGGLRARRDGTSVFRRRKAVTGAEALPGSRASWCCPAGPTGRCRRRAAARAARKGRTRATRLWSSGSTPSCSGQRKAT